MQSRYRLSKTALIAVAFMTTASCSKLADGVSQQSLYPIQPANLRLHLTDAPTDDVKSVNVNIDHVEVLLEGYGKKGRLILAEDFGQVNLLELQNDVLLTMAEVDIPDGVRATQIRLVLKADGHFLTMNDDSICPLQTPSQQKTGIKIVLSSPVEFASGFAYSMVVDFDAKKSIVIQGNGGCLLKPVLKLKSATRIEHEYVGEDGTVEDGQQDEEENLTDGNDDNTTGDSLDGFDPSNPDTWPDGITEDELAYYF